ncbi:MAG: hypothetical protein Q9214_003720 [Letrouitia sp. 1 TL-2023]
MVDPRPHFSLQDEARNTDRHHLWSSNSKLRHTQVTFVSAGDSTPKFRERETLSKIRRNNDNQDSLDTPMASISLNEQSSDDSVPRSSVHGPVHEPVHDALKQTKNLLNQTSAGEGMGQSKGCSPLKHHYQPQTSPNSSDEEIVFRGRIESKKVGIRKRPVDSRNGSLKLPGSHHKTEQEKKLARTNKILSIDDSDSIDSENLAAFGLADYRQLQSQEFELPQASPSVFGESEIDIGPRKHERLDRHEDEILADYIANVRASGDFYLGENTPSFEVSQHMGLATLSPFGKISADSSGMQAGNPTSKPHETEWNPTNLHKYDNVNTTKDVLGEADGKLFQRSTNFTKQRLDTEKAEGTDQAYWMPPNLLQNSGSAAHTIFSISECLEAVHISDTESLQIKDNADDPHGGSILNRGKLKTNSSSTKTAGLFTKLEGLDLGSDESFVLDGIAFDKEGESIDDWDVDELGLSHPIGKKARLRSPKRRVPSSIANWDEVQYQGLDVTLHEGQPVLGKKSLKRRARHTFGPLDTELEVLLQRTWEKDRAKKSVRKQERELRRAHGLLGKKRKGQPEPEDQFLAGLFMQQIIDTINGFLRSSVTSLTLQPMNPLERKFVHEFAHALNLTSKSKGSGTSRYPALFKTSKTIGPDEEGLEMIYERLSRRFRPQLEGLERHKKRNYGPQPRNNRRRNRPGGGGGGGVRCRDGEVVGGTAPEIGQENKGRAMLERMGWSTGTALGALNNKGMLQPVTHIVKTSRAGLG